MQLSFPCHEKKIRPCFTTELLELRDGLRKTLSGDGARAVLVCGEHDRIEVPRFLDQVAGLSGGSKGTIFVDRSDITEDVLSMARDTNALLIIRDADQFERLNRSASHAKVRMAFLEQPGRAQVVANSNNLFQWPTIDRRREAWPELLICGIEDGTSLPDPCFLDASANEVLNEIPWNLFGGGAASVWRLGHTVGYVTDALQSTKVDRATLLLSLFIEEIRRMARVRNVPTPDMAMDAMHRFCGLPWQSASQVLDTAIRTLNLSQACGSPVIERILETSARGSFPPPLDPSKFPS